MHLLQKAPIPLVEHRSAAPLGIGSWRWLLTIYFIVLTTGTHWPKLEPLGPEHTPPDKLMHFLAFGILALLLERARVLPRGWVAFLVILIWIPLDEWTQDLLSPWRHWTLPDVLAGIEGLAAAAIMTAALAPPVTAARTGPWRTAIATIDRLIDRGMGGRTVLALGAIITVVVFPLLYFLVWTTLHRSWSMACGLIAMAIASAVTLPMACRAWKRANGPRWPHIPPLAWIILATGLAAGWFMGTMLAQAGLPGLVVPTSLLIGAASIAAPVRRGWQAADRHIHD